MSLVESPVPVQTVAPHNVFAAPRLHLQDKGRRIAAGGNHMHTRTPGYWCVSQYPLQDSQANIPFDIPFNFLLPMGRNSRWPVDGDRLRPLLHQDPHGGHPLHHWQSLVFTRVERTTPIVIN